jgi:hypothetical protein
MRTADILTVAARLQANCLGFRDEPLPFLESTPRLIAAAISLADLPCDAQARTSRWRGGESLHGARLIFPSAMPSLMSRSCLIFVRTWIVERLEEALRTASIA